MVLGLKNTTHNTENTPGFLMLLYYSNAAAHMHLPILGCHNYVV